MSIRRRLLFLLLSVICGVWGIVTWRVFIDTQHEVEELFDANLAQSARVLLGLVKHEMEEEEKDEDEDDEEEDEEEDEDEDEIELDEHLFGHKYEHKLAFLIRASDGEILVRSATAPLFPLPGRSASLSDYQEDGHLWRVFTLKSGQFFVQTGERYEIRDELITEIMSSTLSVLLMALPILALLIWISVGRSFRPLQQVATDIAARTPEQLQPLELTKIPLEIKVLGTALNSLFSRLERAFENERRFTADAAHELRTPLAGLKRATHLVVQLLALARMDATQTLHKHRVDMYELVSQIIIDFTPQALDKAIDLGLEKTATGCTTQGNQDALYLMVRNFVDNAIRYTPAGGQVTVSLENLQASRLRLSVSDSGFGIPPEQRVRIFERFYRGENQNIPGSGLGLSIAQQVAQLHHVEIQLDDVPGGGSGLCVRVDFPIQSA